MRAFVSTMLMLLMAAPVMAQQNPQMSQQDMQKMMEQAQQMQACMEQVDQSRLSELEQESSVVESDIKALCAEGKRDQAEQRALAFARELEQDEDLQAMRRCGEMMQGMLPPMPYADYGKEARGRHLCDEIGK